MGDCYSSELFILLLFASFCSKKKQKKHLRICQYGYLHQYNSAHIIKSCSGLSVPCHNE